VRAAIAIVIALSASAAADPPASVALLPLDADPKLEIYGQPVASELARALIAGGLDVVVVGKKMAVPDRARVIVDGTIVAQGAGVKLVARIRDRQTGKVLDSEPAEADSLATLDHAASELSSKVLPVVQRDLAELAAEDAKRADEAKAAAQPTRVPQVAPPVALPVVLVSLAPSKSQLHDAIANALDGWAKHGRHDLQLGAADAKAVAAARAEIGVSLDIVGYDLQTLEIASGTTRAARARVRMRVANGTKLVFDRVLETDTVLGQPDTLAELVAREILWIAEPKLRKVSAWH
jgi:hypothetical protein